MSLSPAEQPPDLMMWAELHVVAKARPRSTCHAGMYRNALGPQIGDALAGYRTGVAVQPVA